MNRIVLSFLALVLGSGALVGCGGGSGDETASKGTELVGILRLDPGKDQGGKVTGTYFRMVQVGGTPENGPFMRNADSPADGGEATLLSPGRSGGLRLGGYQSQPDPAFAANGDSLADAITRPTKFFGVAFSIGTNPTDPQTKTKVAPPTVFVEDGKLTADLSSWGVTWNNQVFNQGAPKPVTNTGADAPGQEQAEKVWDWVAGKYLEAAPAATITGEGATGTFDERTGRFTLEWTSLIVGGPFNRFVGRWHLEGVFEEDGRAPDATG